MSMRSVTPIITRGYKNKKSPKPLKTRQSAAKRFIRTANGGLKHKHAGKAHKNISKSKTRLTRLRQTGHLQGTNLKNMQKLLMTGK